MNGKNQHGNSPTQESSNKKKMIEKTWRKQHKHIPSEWERECVLDNNNIAQMLRKIHLQAAHTYITIFLHHRTTKQKQKLSTLHKKMTERKRGWKSERVFKWGREYERIESLNTKVSMCYACFFLLPLYPYHNLIEKRWFRLIRSHLFHLKRNIFFFIEPWLIFFSLFLLLLLWSW